MSFLHYVWSFLLALGVLIFIHELGHYLAARWCGVKVLKFAIGFGKTIYSRRFGADQTEWCVGLFPLGGYVKMLDEQEDEVAEGERHRAFNQQAIWKRSLIVVAGPLANFLLAIVIYWGGFLAGTTELAPILGEVVPQSRAAEAGFVAGERIQKIGGENIQSWSDVRWALIDRGLSREQVAIESQTADGAVRVRIADLRGIVVEEQAPDPVQQFGLHPAQPALPAIVGRVAPSSLAEKAGVRGGDLITHVDGQPITDFRALAEAIGAAGGKQIKLEIQREGRGMMVELVPEMVGEGEARRGRIGIAAQAAPELMARYLVTVQSGPIDALGKALDQTWKMTTFSYKVLWRMITGDVSLRNVSGPLSIADYAGQSASVGLAAYIRFMALISISLGVLNLLPVPILDGGHLLYHALEAVRGKPLPDRVLELAQRSGFALLMGLMLLAMFNDLNRLFFR